MHADPLPPTAAAGARARCRCFSVTSGRGRSGTSTCDEPLADPRGSAAIPVDAFRCPWCRSLPVTFSTPRATPGFTWRTRTCVEPMAGLAIRVRCAGRRLGPMCGALGHLRPSPLPACTWHFLTRSGPLRRPLARRDEFAADRQPASRSTGGSCATAAATRPPGTLRPQTLAHALDDSPTGFARGSSEAPRWERLRRDVERGFSKTIC